MINKKICMVGAFAVGKTSLVKQFVDSIFNEKYHTTIGVKIDKKVVEHSDKTTQLMIWDIEGVDAFTDLNPSYLRGASGILLVLDGTREQSLESAKRLKKLIVAVLGNIPILLIMNKSDLEEDWQFSLKDTDVLEISEQNTFTASAKTGQNVENVFVRISELITE